MNKFYVSACFWLCLVFFVTAHSLASADDKTPDNNKSTEELNVSKEVQEHVLIDPYGEKFKLPAHFRAPVFSSDKWQRQRQSGHYNLGMEFFDFVQKHKLIGMTKKQLLELLGSPNSAKGPDSIRYRLSTVDCGFLYAEFEFAEGKVSRYKVDGLAKNGWITTNPSANMK